MAQIADVFVFSRAYRSSHVHGFADSIGPARQCLKLGFCIEGRLDFADERRQRADISPDRMASQHHRFHEGCAAADKRVQNEVAGLSERFDGRPGELRRKTSRITIKIVGQRCDRRCVGGCLDELRQPFQVWWFKRSVQGFAPVFLGGHRLTLSVLAAAIGR